MVPVRAYEMLAPHAGSGERIKMIIDCLDVRVEPVSAL
jgi:hypothetical protein